MNRPAGTTVWFIQAAGRVWGPYPNTRIASFVEEGRVAAETLVGVRPEGPFAPAAHQVRLRGLFGGAEPADEAAPVPVAAEPPSSAGAPGGSAQALLVFATLRGERADRLEALIGAHGPYVRVQPGLWLVRAPLSPASLRNVLTRRMEAADSVMVVGASADQAAWFNLDGEADRTLRQLWLG